ncbi:MAG: hypothetical protein H8D92_02640 [Pelagibacteraceae bacterium]|nr:hypothetical protein [Pelagibacteraceae bacterium]
MGKIYKTARGRSLDMASLISKHEKTRAVSNINQVNARGDEIDSSGQIVRPAGDKVADSYASQVGSQTAQARPEHPDLSPSANPNAPLSPKQLRELDALNSKQIPDKEAVKTPMLDKLVEESKPQVEETVEPVEEYVAPIEAEIAPIPPVEPEEFVMKSAEEAPDSFGGEGELELHPEEAQLAELEEDFDIEAIKKAALENIVTEQPTAKSKKKGKK